MHTAPLELSNILSDKVSENPNTTIANFVFRVLVFLGHLNQKIVSKIQIKLKVPFHR